MRLATSLVHRLHGHVALARTQFFPLCLHRCYTLSNAPTPAVSVAGSFIFKLDQDSAYKVALFRRSASREVYAHKYAPIAGKIEPSDPSPESTAWREIHEETNLTPSHLRLLRAGNPYSYSDSHTRRWTVYPYAFLLRHPDCQQAFELSDEHDGYAWLDPALVLSNEELEVVPKLRESLARVWPFT
ncbi:hypothetical protein CDD81_5372 [Ophiocordyceps australis]|uniref:Nudix hydrolase domain-containing protein n=1 Tax=Ophiocordyceps australis TaxID=1399860 RepID=A0A2C5YAE3_9HYPO|nr:hypothetical protein CDD81_5372 [Ophiocordyceps australis]